MRWLAAIICAGAAAGLCTGCGGGEGAAAGATVRVYLGAPLCAGAKRALAAASGEAGDLKVSAVCLPPVEGAALGSRRLKLSTIGANARRATQDSSSIAYLEPPGPANRFAEPIVDESGIAYVKARSGASAMTSVLQVVADAGTASGSLRSEVRKTLESR